MKVSKYWKGIIAASTTVLIAVQAAVTDGQIVAGEWVAIGLAVLGAVGVIGIPNRPEEDPPVPGYGPTPGGPPV